ncbi:hypothetical protein PMAYCL1PPCAC_28596, partial [Pristionchus mayeri]
MTVLMTGLTCMGSLWQQLPLDGFVDVTQLHSTPLLHPPHPNLTIHPNLRNHRKSVVTLLPAGDFLAEKTSQIFLMTPSLTERKSELTNSR